MDYKQLEEDVRVYDSCILLSKDVKELELGPHTISVIEDLELERTSENSKHVDELIYLAKCEAFDDYESELTFPILTLVHFAHKYDLKNVFNNARDGKYETPARTS